MPVPPPHNVSRETWARLEEFLVALRQWNRSIQLVGPGQLHDLSIRAVQEADLIHAYLGPCPNGVWVDLGSGGGLPAIPLAILHPEAGLRLTMIESDGRKAAFLRRAARLAGVDARVIAERIEAVPPLGADVITARALAPLAVLAGLARRHLAPGGRLLALKGRRVEEEVAAARRDWRAEIATYPGPGESVLVEMSEIEPNGDGDGGAGGA